jgi:hypothetical protein
MLSFIPSEERAGAPAHRRDGRRRHSGRLTELRGMPPHLGPGGAASGLRMRGISKRATRQPEFSLRIQEHRAGDIHDRGGPSGGRNVSEAARSPSSRQSVAGWSRSEVRARVRRSLIRNYDISRPMADQTDKLSRISLSVGGQTLFCAKAHQLPN